MIKILLILLLMSGNVYALDVERLATAIGKAENSKAHPYGIMVKYKHTSPRKACINTIRHQYRHYLELCRKSGATPSDNVFISYLAITYAPKSVLNDPTGLNAYWPENVKHFYFKP